MQHAGYVAKPSSTRDQSNHPTHSRWPGSGSLIRPVHGDHPLLTWPREIENQARLLRLQSSESSSVASRGPSWNFSRGPIFQPEQIADADIAPVQSDLSTPILQPKLKIGAVDDPLELEASRVADEIMRMPAPAAILGSGLPSVQRKCAACEEATEVPSLRMDGSSLAGQATAVPAAARGVLRSPGQPLDPATRAIMEPRFGRDFSHIRIHADERAAEAARSVSALAYTIGDDIVFGAGRYAPASGDGRRLLAHELTHVVQQSAVPGVGTAAERVHVSADSRMRLRRVAPGAAIAVADVLGTIAIAQSQINQTLGALSYSSDQISYPSAMPSPMPTKRNSVELFCSVVRERKSCSPRRSYTLQSPRRFQRRLYRQPFHGERLYRLGRDNRIFEVRTFLFRESPANGLWHAERSKDPLCVQRAL